MSHQFDEVIRQPSRRRRLWMALMMGSLASFGPFTIDMYLPAFPMLANDLYTSTSLVQLSLTACLLGLALGQLFIGPFSDIYGRRKPLLVGLVIYSIVSIMCAFVPSIWAFVALRFLQGVAGSAGIVISRAIVRDLYTGSEMTKFFSLLMLVNGTAPILAPIAGGQLLRFTSWHGVFLVLSIFGFIMFVTVAIGLQETLPIERRSTGGITGTISTFGKLIRTRTFIGYTLAQGLVFAAMFAYISGSPFVLQSIYGLSPQGFSLFFAINGIGIIIATQITGRLSGRIPESKMLKFGLGLACVSSLSLFAMIIISAGLIAILIPLFFVVSSVGVVSTTCFSLAMQNQGRSAGSASALLGLMSFIAGATVAPFVGIAGEHTPVPMGIAIAVCNVAAVICYVFLVHRPKQMGNELTV